MSFDVNDLLASNIRFPIEWSQVRVLLGGARYFKSFPSEPSVLAD
jgi:hypothetical protein